MRWLGHVMRMAPNRTPKVALHWTSDTIWQEKKRQTKNNMEEDNYIRAGRNKFFYRPGSVRYKGQRKMTANC
jgi:hypothetical protein